MLKVDNCIYQTKLHYIGLSYGVIVYNGEKLLSFIFKIWRGIIFRGFKKKKKHDFFVIGFGKECLIINYSPHKSFPCVIFMCIFHCRNRQVLSDDMMSLFLSLDLRWKVYNSFLAWLLRNSIFCRLIQQSVCTCARYDINHLIFHLNNEKNLILLNPKSLYFFLSLFCRSLFLCVMINYDHTACW